MKITTTTDPNAVKVKEDEAVILAEDMDWLKELVKNIRNCSDNRIRREAEHDFCDDMRNRYGEKVAGELLGMLWMKCK